ncbi:hypothetical protein L0244_35130, partial [bacterium]|nr:hypothetical protein [bacterium]
LEPLFIEIIETWYSERLKSGTYWEETEKMLPPSRRLPLKTVAYAVCVSSTEPLSLHEIDRKVRIGGYQSRAKSLTSYLRRIMRQDSRFVCLSDGKWTISRA